MGINNPHGEQPLGRAQFLRVCVVAGWQQLEQVAVRDPCCCLCGIECDNS